VVRRQQVPAKAVVDRQLGIDAPVVLRVDGVLPADRVAGHEAGNAGGREVRLGDEHVRDLVSGVALLESERVAEEVEAFTVLRAVLIELAPQESAAELYRMVSLQPRDGVGRLQRLLLDDVLAEVAEVLDIGAVTASDQRDAIRHRDAAGTRTAERRVLIRSEADRKKAEVEIHRTGAEFVDQVRGEDVGLTESSGVAFVLGCACAEASLESRNAAGIAERVSPMAAAQKELVG